MATTETRWLQQKQDSYCRHKMATSKTTLLQQTRDADYRNKMATAKIRSAEARWLQQTHDGYSRNEMAQLLRPHHTGIMDSSWTPQRVLTVSQVKHPAVMHHNEMLDTSRRPETLRPSLDERFCHKNSPSSVCCLPRQPCHG